MHVSIGRTGFQRRAISPTGDGARAPTCGDRPPRGGASERLLRHDRAERHPRRDDDPEKCVAAQATITHSHVWEISSCQPPLRSAKKLRRSPSRRLRDRRRSASEVALTAKVAESTTKTLPGFVVAATTPAHGRADDEREAAR